MHTNALIEDAKQELKPRPWYRPSLTTMIFVGLVFGIALGYAGYRHDQGLADADKWHIGEKVYFLRDIFLHLIKSIIAPLVFSTLVIGIAGGGELKKVGRMGAKALIYFEIVTTIALAIGLIVVNVTKPGVGVQLVAQNAEQGIGAVAQTKPLTWQEIIVHAVPANIFEAMEKGDVLQIVVFAVLFSMAVVALGERARPVVVLAEATSQVMMRLTNYVMLFAPVGIAAAMAHTVDSHGLQILLNLGKLIGSLYASLIFFALFVFGGVMLICRIPVAPFLKAIREPATIAFATTSSESALPKAMEQMERFGVPPSIVGFVMPTGYSFNLDGTTLYLALASVFVAQAAETTFGPSMHMSIGQQIIMMFTLMLTSKGVAAVPRASMVVLLATLDSFMGHGHPGIGAIGVFIIMGVDEIMDMARTCVNVVGNCLATCVVARWEGEFDDVMARTYGTPMEIAVAEQREEAEERLEALPA